MAATTGPSTTPWISTASATSASTIGFFADQTKRIDKNDPRILQYVEPDDLLRFGLIPELIGRMPVITALDPLADEAMKRILTEPKNALVKQYQKLFAMDGIDLIFDEEALDVVVYHPDSDTGPSRDDHPMLNRTWIAGQPQGGRT